MVSPYLPEGRLLFTPENLAAVSSPESLRAAKDRGTILEGRVLSCTPEHDLMVRVGQFTGRIPRSEALLGEGKEIAVLSRVGKPISFTVVDIPVSSPLLLSRRAAQERAFDYWLSQPPGTVLPATVTHLEGFGAFVDVACGVISMIGIEDISVARIPHPRCRFRVGQEIFAVLTGADPQAEKLYLSHKELLGTWLENAAPFSPGQTCTGILRSIRSYGTFVELTPNFVGLTDQTEGLTPGDLAAVHLKAIHPAGMKVKLTVLHTLGRAPAPTPLSYVLPRGRLTKWVYSPPQSKRVLSRDFTLQSNGTF